MRIAGKVPFAAEHGRTTFSFGHFKSGLKTTPLNFVKIARF
jgi:hypothetical protein